MSAPSVCLTWGKVTQPETALAREGAEIAARGGGLGRQVALIGTGTGAFRLNTPGAFRIDPDLVAALADRAGLRTLCLDRLEATIPSFAARARRWIAGYAAALDAAFPIGQVEAPMIEDASDRFFAGLLPMAAAQVAPADGDGSVGGGFVPVDLAFWDGQRITAALFGGENRATPGARAALARLGEALGSRLAVRRIESDADAGALMDDMLAAAREAPPPWFGPYRASALQAPLPEA